MKLEVSKGGQGAFSIKVFDDGKTQISLYADHSNPREFATPEEAYDFCRPPADMGNSSYWNICYHLEDLIV